MRRLAIGAVVLTLLFSMAPMVGATELIEGQDYFIEQTTRTIYVRDTGDPLNNVIVANICAMRGYSPGPMTIMRTSGTPGLVPGCYDKSIDVLVIPVGHGPGQVWSTGSANYIHERSHRAGWEHNE